MPVLNAFRCPSCGKHADLISEVSPGAWEYRCRCGVFGFAEWPSGGKPAVRYSIHVDDQDDAGDELGEAGA